MTAVTQWSMRFNSRDPQVIVEHLQRAYRSLFQESNVFVGAATARPVGPG